MIGTLVSNLINREQGKIERMIAKLAAEEAQKGESAATDDTDAIADEQTSMSESDKADEQDTPDSTGAVNPTNAGTDPKPKKGHGRNGAVAYTKAKDFCYKLAMGIVGSICLACNSGRMRNYRPKVVIRVVGQPIFSAEIHEAEQARCKVCGKVITAQLPANIEDGLGKAVIYHWSACAMLTVLHYTGGVPFKRMEMLHESWGIPFADSNQWEIVDQSMVLLSPLLRAIEQHGIQKVMNLRIDDTGSMVIELKRQIIAELEEAKVLGKSLESVRTGINATCVYIETSEGKVILFFTGRHHAGEIIDRILKHRRADSGKVIKVTDGASKNFDHSHSDKVTEAVCNAHAFLKFHDIKEQFPIEYSMVGECYHQVFENDDTTKERRMTPEQRLTYHQQHSQPLMEKIKSLCAGKIQDRLVEPRSPLWEPINFFINQWPKLTQFLRVPGVPLDTNLVEQTLIIPVRYLAASFNYQTANGAEVGDAAMSLTATARACDVEPVAYLAHCLENHKDLKEHPEKYLPWNYRDRMAIRDKPPPD